MAFSTQPFPHPSHGKLLHVLCCFLPSLSQLPALEVTVREVVRKGDDFKVARRAQQTWACPPVAEDSGGTGTVAWMGGYACPLQKGRRPVVFIVTSSKTWKTGTLGVGGTGLGWFRAQVALESGPGSSSSAAVTSRDHGSASSPVCPRVPPLSKGDSAHRSGAVPGLHEIMRIRD